MSSPLPTYFDANASEPIRPQACAAALTAMQSAGNPSSVHAAGRAARRRLEDAREALMQRFDVGAAELVFTSGGTEANALAIHALGRGRAVLIGATEHDAVRAAAPGAAVVPVDAEGVLDLAALAAMLSGTTPALVCVMLANNETGVLHPLAAVAATCRSHGAALHVDAVQAAGRLPVSFAASGADSMALSSHKLGGPPGAGALLIRASAVSPLIAGGGQEGGWRGGTPGLPAIAGFAAAAGAAAPDLAPLRDRLEAAAVAAGAVAVGAAAARLGNTSCLALPGVAAQTQVMALDLAGFQVSAGAACSSGKVARSHVLDAMRLGPLAGEAIRVSLPWSATAAEVERFVAAYQAMAKRLVRRAA